MKISSLTEEEKKRLNELEQKISAAQKERVSFLREIFRRRGLIAPTLEELNLSSGRHFVKEKPRGMRGQDYGRASVIIETKFGPLVEVSAYFCKEMDLREDPDSCGWVMGEPEAREYNDIGLLSGSAGTQYCCRICGKMIGEHQLVVS